MPFYAQWWIHQNSGVTANLNDVYGISGNNVVIVGNAGVILKTTDGGTHWNIKVSGTVENLTKVQFVNATIGYVVGTSGTILKTIDAGENWTSIATGNTTNLYGLSCVNENIFYISGDNGLIKKTVDGGASLIDQSLVLSHPIKSIQFLNNQMGYASSYDYTGYNSFGFFKTTDGGATWMLQSNPVTTFFFLDENVGFVTFEGIKKTIDGGLNFTNFGYPFTPPLDLFSSNANEIWSVSNSYALCGCSYFCIDKSYINNAGNLEQAQNCYPDTVNPPFEAITFADATNGYVVGDFGVIYKNTTGNMENLGLNELAKANNAIIYPNPATNSIMVENKSDKAVLSIIISDMNGRKILATTMVNSTIDISSLAKGVYLVGLTFDDKSVTQKLIKQ